MPSILITDDDAAFRETLHEVFAPEGFRVLLAEDGEQAIAIVQRIPVDVALMDVHMPKVTGLEAARQVKRLREILPCILLSANLTEQLVREAKSVPVFSVLAKPVTRARITGVVRQALQRTYGWAS